MRTLSQYKISVRAQAYVVLGMSLLWWGIVFGSLFGIIPENALTTAVENLLFAASFILSVILWDSYRKAGRFRTRLVNLAIFVATIPWWLMVIGILMKPW